MVRNFYSNNYIRYDSNGENNKTLAVKQYLDEIKPYFKDIINNLKKSYIAVNFMSSKDTDEEHVMHSASGNIEIMINYKTDEVIIELRESLLSTYQSSLEKSMKGSDIMLIYCICHKIIPKWGR